MTRVIRVVVVDDSAYVRKVIKQMLSRSPFIEVVGTCRDGEEALETVSELQPDVVTLDLIMPGMGGLGFLQKQMARQPLPVIVVSISNETSQQVLEALDLGAVDFVQKPSALATEKVLEMSEELISKVKTAAAIPMKRVQLAPQKDVQIRARRGVAPRKLDAIVVGLSTGGPQALKQVFPLLPADFPIPIVVVLHMPAGYTEMYAESLGKMTRLKTVHSNENDELKAGHLYIAQAGRHLTLKRNGDSVRIHLDARPLDLPHRPSVDVLFRSAAQVFGDKVLGIVMTGMGDDGKAGSAEIKERGGTIFTEAEETCVVYGMPRSVVEANLSDRVIPLQQMAEALLEVAYGKSTDS
jgi:two-component system chemotaxis response regulator CheB